MSATSTGPQSNQLCLAAGRGESDIIRELVKNGAKFDPDENGRTALHYAANYGRTVSLKVCLQLGCKLDLQDKNGCTALHRAVLDGQIDTVKVLLYEGCAVDRQDENGNTALHEAAWGGYSKILEVLVKRGKAHIHCSNKHGHKAIHLACQNGHNESTRILLRAGSNPNTKNNNGDTPLHVSSLFGHITCTRILISAGSNINIKNKDGNTPLHVAADLGKQKITRVLLEAKCDTNLRNNDNLTAVEMARRNNYSETVLLILSAHRIWRGSMSQRKPRKSKSSKEDKKKQQKQADENEVDHAGPCERVKGRRELREEDKVKRQDARNRTEERIMMNENYDKWRELQGTLVRQELRKQADIHTHKHKKSLTTGHNDCKACFQKLENQIEASKEKLQFEIETAKACFEHKLRKMDRKMNHQAACMDRLCKERIKAETTECLHRIDKRAIEERAAWADENDVRLELVKDDLRNWVQGRLQNVQEQLRQLNERELSGSTGLRVRSKSESDLGVLDSMDETEVDDTDGEDIQGIVIGRGKCNVFNEDELQGDEIDGNESTRINKEEERRSQKRRPMMRGRNVRTGKYGKPQVSMGRSQSLDRHIEIATRSCEARIDSESEYSSENEHTQTEGGYITQTKHDDFSIPTNKTMTSDCKFKGQEVADDVPKRTEPAQCTMQSIGTSSFTRTVQHDMRTAASEARAENDSEGSGRAMVEGTYRPPIVVVSEPHRMGSYAANDGVQPANLSSAESDSATNTFSITSSEGSLVPVTYMAYDDSSASLTSQKGTMRISHLEPVPKTHSHQSSSDQSEFLPSTSQISSKADAAKKLNSNCSKSSSGISSGTSTTYLQHCDPMNDVVVRASSIEHGATDRLSSSRNRSFSTVDIPPHQSVGSNRYSYRSGDYSSSQQQYVTTKSAYSAHHQTNQPSSQHSASQYSYTQPQRASLVQPPEFRSSKTLQPLASGSRFAARSPPSHSRIGYSNNTYGKMQQEQQQSFQGENTLQKYMYEQGQKTQSEQTNIPVRHYQQVPTQMPKESGTESCRRKPLEQHSVQRSAIASQRYEQVSSDMNRQAFMTQSINPSLSSSEKPSSVQDNSFRFANTANRSGQLLRNQQKGSYNSSSQPVTQSATVQSNVPTPHVRLTTSDMNKNVMPMTQHTRPQTPHSVTHVNVPLSATQRSQGANSQSRNERNIMGRMQVENTSTAQPVMRDTVSVDQRSSVKRTYEISF